MVVLSNPPYAMAWTAQHICVAGPDKKVVFYTQEGMLAQQFDYFRSVLPKRRFFFYTQEGMLAHQFDYFRSVLPKRRFVFYTHEGMLAQQFDFFRSFLPKKVCLLHPGGDASSAV